ncbi:MAG: FxsA family protein [Nocardioidaceae bacterium]
MRFLILLGMFVLLPIIEIYVIIQVGQEIGALSTVLLLLAVSVAGAWLVKREGRRAWSALQEALSTGRMPGKELADGGLLLVGGALLLTPGFVTDACGFLLVLPFTRPVARRLLASMVSRRVVMGSRDPYAGRRGGAHQIFHEDDHP